MQYKALALAALAAGVSAQIPTDSIGASVVSVLLTAIPPESISLALANQRQFSAELASSLAAGKTPEWYLALPSDVKSYLPILYPAATTAVTTAPATETPSITPTPESSPSPLVTGTISGGTTASGNKTAILTVSSATLASTGGANSESPIGTAASTGGASHPTAIFGAGIAGAIGFLGMLAL